MTTRLLFASLLLAATPCALAQTAPPPPAGQDGAAPVVRVRQTQGKMAEEKGRREGRGGEMGGGRLREGGPEGRLPPPGTWWRDAALAGRIGLSAEQVKRIDELFMQSRVQLIDLHAALEKEELLLEPVMNANPVDQSKALGHINKIADERAELEKTNAKMLLGIRSVLSAEQWTKLQAEHHGMMMMHGGRDGDAGGPGHPGMEMRRGQPGPPPPGRE